MSDTYKGFRIKRYQEAYTPVYDNGMHSAIFLGSMGAAKRAIDVYLKSKTQTPIVTPTKRIPEDWLNKIIDRPAATYSNKNFKL
jgi:hypothetical protein